jgi:hypothetical protein
MLSVKLHNEELHNFYPSPNIIRMIKSAGVLMTEILPVMLPVFTAHHWTSKLIRVILKVDVLKRIFLTVSPILYMSARADV